MSSLSAGSIASFVFVDLETTGIPSHEQNRTTITEVSFVAVKRAHLLDCPIGETPRVQHKLTLCLNPRRFINPHSTDITGLSNDLLEHESHFDDNVFDTLNSFLSTLEKPACLLAHNGLTFDFPILRASLEKIEKRFPDNLLCADTLHAYTDILSRNPTTADETDLSVPTEKEFEVDFQLQNESTPKRNKIEIVPATPSKRKPSADKREKSAKRRLTYGEMKGKRLSDIYRHLLGKPAVNCHRAESDCLLNLEASAAVAEQFARWVDDNHCVFNDIEPMRVGVPLK